MTTKPKYRVRKQSSGRTFSETYHVVVAKRGVNGEGKTVTSWERVTVWPYTQQDQAQAHADRLNIAAAVKDYDEDPRPYAVRLAEAETAFHAAKAGA